MQIQTRKKKYGYPYGRNENASHELHPSSAAAVVSGVPLCARSAFQHDRKPARSLQLRVASYVISDFGRQQNEPTKKQL
jgi:hypothetical protein